MVPSLIILTVLVVTGLILYIHDRLTRRPQRQEGTSDTSGDAETASAEAGTTSTPAERPAGCCGMHQVCEKATEAALTENYYYDDEELDRFAGRAADAYSEQEIEEFRDVMLTLPSDEVLAWSQAIEHRRIVLPAALRDELILLINPS